MGLFKADFYRFFAIGFGGGALLVAAVLGFGSQRPLVDNIVPAAQAEPTR